MVDKLTLFYNQNLILPLNKSLKSYKLGMRFHLTWKIAGSPGSTSIYFFCSNRWWWSFGVKFKDNICDELWLKLWSKNGRYWCNINVSGWFWKRISKNKAPNNFFFKSVSKRNCKSVHCKTLDSFVSNKTTKHQLPHTRFNQVSDHKHVISL